MQARLTAPVSWHGEGSHYAFFHVLNHFTNHSDQHFHMQAPNQVALHSQNREAALKPTTGITGPPGTGRHLGLVTTSYYSDDFIASAIKGCRRSTSSSNGDLELGPGVASIPKMYVSGGKGGVRIDRADGSK